MNRAPALRQLFAMLDAAGSARRLAQTCRREAKASPRHANELLSEAARHKDRARDWLMRASWTDGPALP